MSAALTKVGRTFCRAALAILVLASSALAKPAAVRRPASTAALDTAFARYEEKVGLSRRLGGALSIVSGAFVGFGGFWMSLDQKVSLAESLGGMGGTLLGAVNGFEGLIRVFSPSPLQRLLPHYRALKPGDTPPTGATKLEYGEWALRWAAEDAGQARVGRAVLDLAMAAGCAGVALSTVRRWLYYPAGALAVMGVYRLVFRSPEELAWAGYREGKPGGAPEADLTLLPPLYVGVNVRF